MNAFSQLTPAVDSRVEERQPNRGLFNGELPRAGGRQQANVIDNDWRKRGAWQSGWDYEIGQRELPILVEH